MAVGEIAGALAGGLSSLKSALEIIKSLKDPGDAGARNSKSIELQQLVMSALDAVFEGRKQIWALESKVQDLNVEILQLLDDRAKLDRYRLIEVDSGVYAYMLKREHREGFAPHLVCTKCFQDGKISILQWGTDRKISGRRGHACPTCKLEIFPSHDSVSWPANN